MYESVKLVMSKIKSEKQIVAQWQKNQPMVSICCTAYNQEKYIEEALKSFLLQETSFPFEIIISDDCSTDRTTEILRRYAKQYPNIIRLIYQEKNKYSEGALPIRDFILPEVKGKYIALCEGDDYWTDSTKLQQQVDFLEQNIEFMGCGHNTRFLINGELTDRLFVDSNNKKDSYIFEDFIDSAYLHTTSLVFRYDSKHKDQIDEYLAKYSSVKRNDVYMLLVFSKFGSIKYIDRIMSVYRMNDGGIWSGANEQAQLIMFLHGCIDFSYIFGDEYKDKFLYSFANTFSESLDTCTSCFVSEVLNEFSEKDLRVVVESFAKYKKQDNETIKNCSEYIDFLEEQVNDNSLRSFIVKLMKVVKIYPVIKNIRAKIFK
ncbi:glycosyltransferase [Francisella philomiragia]|uniref:Glycosyltransferase involved in cell wall biogenesis-like protein n=2 Tax=Francisella philomiragia TaxID=28110 RepID=B0TXN1_FRAP2|nr:glycosyl transferase 2 family protein [Francisella philomiragia]AJI49319.1 glycosyltransferase like 2 family protein [Francisella philomiragia]MBK2020728.1 glycosyltransferase [Francisella philomiragia]MBK2030852.1 glycosyltransferase [Francisella philomiragia]MBK2263490.1 glycosyltransferase [Francisella philomiragia]